MTLSNSNFCRIVCVYFEMNLLSNYLINIERFLMTTFKKHGFCPHFPSFYLAEYSVSWPKLSVPNIRPIWPKLSAEYSVSVVHYLCYKVISSIWHTPKLCTMFVIWHPLQVYVRHNVTLLSFPFLPLHFGGSYRFSKTIILRHERGRKVLLAPFLP